MGLAIVKRIVDHHKGTISIKSEPAKGSVFTIRLPAFYLEGEDEIAQSNRFYSLEPMRILLVDDDHQIREVTSEYLTFAGHRVECARSGEDALQKICSAHFDLVITDRVMPDVSGDRLASEIRRRMPAKPIILLTGYPSQIDQDRETKDPSVNAVLSKPVSFFELQETLVRVVNSRQG